MKSSRSSDRRMNYNGCNSDACYCTDKTPAEKLQLPTLNSNTQLSKSPLSGRAWLLALVVGVSSLLFQVAGFVEYLRFSRQEILDGEWWRVLTGNLVHLGYPHLMLNLTGLLVITLLLAPAMTAWQWFLTGLGSMLGVGVGLLLFDPQLSWYVGLSGALYGLLLGGAIAEFQNQRLIATLLATYTVGKVVWEQWYGAVESSETISGGTVIVNAHMYGMIAGGFTVCLLLGFRHLSGKAKCPMK